MVGTLCLLVFACFLIFKIYKLVKFSDPPMLLSIISITIALALLLAFCGLDIASFYAADDDFLNTNLGTDMTEQLDRLKVMLIFCAFVFDLHKWCVFIAATTPTQVKHSVWHRRLTKGLIVTQVVYVALSLTLMVGVMATASVSITPSDSNTKWMNVQYLFISATFGSFLIAYSLAFLLLISRLRRHFPAFYKNERTKLFIASTSIVISIIARMAINAVYSVESINTELDQSFKQGTWLFPLVNFLSMVVASLFPIGSIIYSLMYAITHKKRMISRGTKKRALPHSLSRCESVHSLLLEEVEAGDEDETLYGRKFMASELKVNVSAPLMMATPQYSSSGGHFLAESYSEVRSNESLPHEPESLSPLHRLQEPPQFKIGVNRHQEDTSTLTSI